MFIGRLDENFDTIVSKLYLSTVTAGGLRPSGASVPTRFFLRKKQVKEKPKGSLGRLRGSETAATLHPFIYDGVALVIAPSGRPAAAAPGKAGTAVSAWLYCPRSGLLLCQL